MSITKRHPIFDLEELRHTYINQYGDDIAVAIRMESVCGLYSAHIFQEDRHLYIYVLDLVRRNMLYSEIIVRKQGLHFDLLLNLFEKLNVNGYENDLPKPTYNVSVRTQSVGIGQNFYGDEVIACERTIIIEAADGSEPTRVLKNSLIADCYADSHSIHYQSDQTFRDMCARQDKKVQQIQEHVDAGNELDENCWEKI